MNVRSMPHTFSPNTFSGHWATNGEDMRNSEDPKVRMPSSLMLAAVNPMLSDFVPEHT